MRSTLTEDDVLALARAAHLPLARERVAILLPTLGAWLVDAEDLNRKMSEPAHSEILPITVFSHTGRP